MLAWRVLECRGCGGISFEVETFVEGDPLRLEYFPERLDRKIPSRFFRAPEVVSQIYNEVVAAFNHTSPQALKVLGMPFLCAIGLRTLLEGILTDKGIKDGPRSDGKGRSRMLAARIPELKRLMPAHIVDRLHTFKIFGNEAAHRQTAPSRKELHLGIRVMEDLLNFFYELDYNSALLYTRASPQQPETTVAIEDPRQEGGNATSSSSE